MSAVIEDLLTSDWKGFRMKVPRINCARVSTILKAQNSISHSFSRPLLSFGSILSELGDTFRLGDQRFDGLRSVRKTVASGILHSTAIDGK